MLESTMFNAISKLTTAIHTTKCNLSRGSAAELPEIEIGRALSRAFQGQ